MDGRDGLLLWVLGGAGVLFLYAAYSKQHPGAVLAKTLNTGAPAARESAPGGPVPKVPTAPAFQSRLAPTIPDPYAATPNLRIPGTVNV
jgi:hypothetical protein